MIPQPWLILAGVAAVLLGIGYVRHDGYVAGVQAERSKWQEKQREAQEAHNKAVADAVEKANERAAVAQQRSAELSARVREIEDATRNRSQVCVSGPDAARLRRLRN